jgi:hypothetical protein
VNTERTPSGDPMSPRSSRCLMRSTCGWNRKLKPIMPTVRARRHASTTRTPSADDGASGFSTYTCSPASNAAIAHGA